ncbi:hypothetical protein CEXT_34161 [Caerostris extrusa]|uniref:Uncharacterized protein n=1 Tax=Caerostris extrusa TaxID=172846 RepID=A0AAV4PJP4_CAEEX|nr:hypothetical protein CEXT_34161 [Caerostris extrusa]
MLPKLFLPLAVEMKNKFKKKATLTPFPGRGWREKVILPQSGSSSPRLLSFLPPSIQNVGRVTQARRLE